MRKYLIMAAVLFSVLSCVTLEKEEIKEPEKSVDLSGIFEPLDAEVSVRRWGMNNQAKADIFREIFDQYSGETGFPTALEAYADNSNKCYWIGIYLNSDYTGLGLYEDSLELLKKGLTLASSEAEQVRFNYVIGKSMYYRGDLQGAVPYLVAGYRLSEKYPGTTPAWNSEEEYNTIMALILKNL